MNKSTTACLVIAIAAGFFAVAKPAMHMLYQHQADNARIELTETMQRTIPANAPAFAVNLHQNAVNAIVTWTKDDVDFKLEKGLSCAQIVSTSTPSTYDVENTPADLKNKSAEIRSARLNFIKAYCNVKTH